MTTLSPLEQQRQWLKDFQAAESAYTMRETKAQQNYAAGEKTANERYAAAERAAQQEYAAAEKAAQLLAAKIIAEQDIHNGSRRGEINTLVDKIQKLQDRTVESLKVLSVIDQREAELLAALNQDEESLKTLSVIDPVLSTPLRGIDPKEPATPSDSEDAVSELGAIVTQASNIEKLTWELMARWQRQNERNAKLIMVALVAIVVAAIIGFFFFLPFIL